MTVRSALRNLFLQPAEQEAERGLNPYSWNQFLADYNSAFAYGGIQYGTMVGTSETIDEGFEGLIQGAVKSDGVVFGCMLARQMVFSDVRFIFRELRNGTPGDFIGNPDGRNPASGGLRLLQTPWIGGTTGDLLARMIQDADLSGNAFVARREGQLVRLRPDWVTIVAETPGDASLWHPDAKVLGYIYNPGGPATDDKPISFLREEVAHFAPIPDPQQRFRGMSWLEPIISEIISDRSMTSHKQKFFENGATVNMILRYDKDIPRQIFDFAKESFNEQHQGVGNAYKTLHLLGAEPVPVGTNMQQMDFKTVQGHGETRIAVAAGVPPIIVGLSEGLEAATYSNYGQARRAFADRTIRPLWRNACASLAQIIPAPSNSELWYDDSDVAFIREDQKDAADIRAVDAQTIKSLVDSGYKPETVVDAVTAGGDWKRLKHTNLFSVQLQPPGTQTPKKPTDPNQQQMPMDPEDMPEPKALPAEKSKEEIAEEIARKADEKFMDRRVSALELAASQRSQELHIHNQQPEISVNPEINIERQDVEIHTPPVTVEPHFDIAGPDINVTTPDVNVDVQTPEVRVDVQLPELRVEPTPIEVNVEAPQITVEGADINVEVEPTPLEVRVDSPVTVEVPEQEAPVVNISMPKTKKKLIRDEQGKVTGMEEEIDEGDE